jgi:ABC-type Co2+ transport system permease subunit
MLFNANDYIGFAGVFILLIAFLLNIAGKLSRENIFYILMNIIGAALACFASYLIHYIPFIILEGTWTFVSLTALLKYRSKKK